MEKDSIWTRRARNRKIALQCAENFAYGCHLWLRVTQWLGPLACLCFAAKAIAVGVLILAIDMTVLVLFLGNIPYARVYLSWKEIRAIIGKEF